MHTVSEYPDNAKLSCNLQFHGFVSWAHVEYSSCMHSFGHTLTSPGLSHQMREGHRFHGGGLQNHVWCHGEFVVKFRITIYITDELVENVITFGNARMKVQSSYGML